MYSVANKARLKAKTILFRQQIIADDRYPFGCGNSEMVGHFALCCNEQN
jgi:hypothetical protein